MLDNIYVSTYGNLPKRREFGNLNYMKYSLRFNPPEKWNVVKSHNRYFFGLIHQLQFLQYHFKEKGGLKITPPDINDNKNKNTSIYLNCLVNISKYCRLNKVTFVKKSNCWVIVNSTWHKS